MPLAPGSGNIRKNVSELMQAPKSAARKKAIITLSRKHNISRKDAQFRQAVAIARTVARKKV